MELRKRTEKEYHDMLRNEDFHSSKDYEYFTSNKKWYSVVRSSRAFVHRWLEGNCKNKTVLDYCCGNGDMSVKVAKMNPLRVVGIDISETSVKNATRLATEEDVSEKTHFDVVDAEKTAFAKSSFDIAFELGVLHHLDLEKSYSEVARILKPHGQFLCVEALGHNPIIQWYRKRTPNLRTAWETKHILKKKDIFRATEYFHRVNILGFFHLFVMAAVPFRNMRGFNLLLRPLEALDSVLLKIPLIKWQAWQVIFELSEPKK